MQRFPERDSGWYRRDTFPPLNERLYQPPGLPFWKGTDLAVAQDVILKPNFEATPVELHIIPDNLPPLDVFYPQDIPSLRVAVRSRDAQTGITLPDYLAIEVYQAMRLAFDRTGTVQTELDVTTSFTNVSARPLALKAGDEVARFFFWDALEHTILNWDLNNMISQGKIKIHGKEGVDWKYHYNHLVPGKENDITGLHVRVDPESVQWIPPNDTPLAINHTTPNSLEFRAELDQHFIKPVPETDEQIAYVGELAPFIEFPEDVVAILSREVFPESEIIIETHRRGIHLNSLLLERGKRYNWRYRVEIVSATTPHNKPEWVIVRFARAKAA